MLNFKNSEIEIVANFLRELPLKTKASRARTMLIKKLDDKFGDYAGFQKEIIDEFGKRNEDRELYQDGQGNFHWQTDKVVEANEMMNELGQEVIYLDIEEYRPNIKFLTLALADLDMELSGNEALIYDSLMDKLEEETE